MEKMGEQTTVRSKENFEKDLGMVKNDDASNICNVFLIFKIGFKINLNSKKILINIFFSASPTFYTNPIRQIHKNLFNPPPKRNGEADVYRKKTARPWKEKKGAAGEGKQLNKITLPFTR